MSRTIALSSSVRGPLRLVGLAAFIPRGPPSSLLRARRLRPRAGLHRGRGVVDVGGPAVALTRSWRRTAHDWTARPRSSRNDAGSGRDALGGQERAGSSARRAQRDPRRRVIRLRPPRPHSTSHPPHRAGIVGLASAWRADARARHHQRFLCPGVRCGSATSPPSRNRACRSINRDHRPARPGGNGPVFPRCHHHAGNRTKDYSHVIDLPLSIGKTLPAPRRVSRSAPGCRRTARLRTWI